MSKLTDVIAAMREAGGNKERFTAGWIELSCTHKGLHDALKTVFKCKPTAQRLGLWLSENVGAQSGEFVLLGRHSTNAKAWRYAVRKPAEHEELKAAKVAKKPGPAAMIVQVQGPADATLNPYQFEPLTTTRVDGTGRLVHTPVLGRDGMPVAAVPEAKAPEPKPEEPGAAPGNPLMPIWVQENRTATRAEWEAHQRERFRPPSIHHNVSGQVSEETGGYYNGVGGVTQLNGVYVPPANDRRDGWRHGGPNWRQKL